jgi:hypothetical protein
VRAVREGWVVDTDGLSAEERARTVREVLDLFRSDVAEVELDVVAPGARPPGFAEAASLLCRRGSGPVEVPAYWTFHRAPVDDEVWAAVLTVVPSSFDADFYEPEAGVPIVSLADEATSFVVRATGPRLAEVEVLVGTDRLVSLGEWHARRRASRHDVRRRRSRREVGAPPS